jgi:hypothetical protein
MSGIISKLLGLSNSLIQLGLGGPNLRNNGGVVEARNPANSAFAVVRGANAVSSNDLVTLSQLPAAGGWQTAMDLDFSAQPNQSFPTDGTYTIAGNANWVKTNSANEVTHAQIINGTGLQFTPGSTSDYNGSNYSLPLLWVPLSSILPSSYDWATGIRVYASIGTDNVTANYDNEVIGVNTNTSLWGVALKRGFGTGGQGLAYFWNINGSNASGFQTSLVTLNSTTKTLCLELNRVTANTSVSYWTAQIAAGVAFPLLNTYSTTLLDAFLASLSPTSGGDTLANFGVMLGAQRAGSATAFNTIFQRLRVDYHP